MVWYRDPSGSLRFSKKATLHAKGVDFEDGKSFQINMDEIEVVGELGKGNYGSVQQVYHRPSGISMAMKVCHSLLFYSSSSIHTAFLLFPLVAVF
jgi:hypothetical protein